MNGLERKDVVEFFKSWILTKGSNSVEIIQNEKTLDIKQGICENGDSVYRHQKINFWIIDPYDEKKQMTLEKIAISAQETTFDILSHLNTTVRQKFDSLFTDS